MIQALEQFLSLLYHKLRRAGKQLLKDRLCANGLKCYHIFPLEKQQPIINMPEGKGLFHISQQGQKRSEFLSGLQLFCLLHTLEEFPRYPSEMLFLLSGCYLEIMTKQENFTGKTHFFLSFCTLKFPLRIFGALSDSLLILTTEIVCSTEGIFRSVGWSRMIRTALPEATRLVCCLRGAGVAGLVTLLQARGMSLSCWIVNCN